MADRAQRGLQFRSYSLSSLSETEDIRNLLRRTTLLFARRNRASALFYPKAAFTIATCCRCLAIIS